MFGRRYLWFIALQKKFMKKIFVTTLLATSVCFTNAQVKEKAKPDCKPGVTINSNFSKAPALDSILKAYTSNALPGAAMAVYSEAEGWWAGAQGYADVEHKIPMDNCHLQ